MTLSQLDMEHRIVRYRDLVPCKTAFIDARTPGSDKKENFCIIGPGVAENPGQHVHVKIPHGFNIGGARQPVGCVNSQHSHETAEVFLVHSGAWAFRWGHDGGDGEVILHPGDVISIPVNVFRGFECVDGEDSFLFAILGGDDPGHVTWAPYVFENAKEHGLVLTQAGRLIDMAAGETIPDGDRPCQPTLVSDLSRFRRMTADEMGACVIRRAEIKPAAGSVLAGSATGICEVPLLGPENLSEGMPAGKVSQRHGFHFRFLTFEAGGEIAPHSREEEEVIFVQSGSLLICWDEGETRLFPGDTATLPKSQIRSYIGSTDEMTELYIVRGGDSPAAPQFVDLDVDDRIAGIR